MRIFMVILLVTAATADLCAQKTKNYSATGLIKGLQAGVEVKLIHQDFDNGKRFVVDSVLSEKGKFLLEGVLAAGPDQYTIELGSPALSVTLFLEYDTIVMKGDIDSFNKIILPETVFYREEEEFQEKINAPSNKANDKARKELSEAEKLKDSAKIEMAKKKMEMVYQEYLRKRFEFMKARPASWFAIGNLLQENIDDSRVFALYDSMDAEIKTSAKGLYLSRQISILKRVGVGQQIIDFTGMTSAGKTIQLKNVIAGNKLTLIDFWASWCYWCRKEIPNMRKMSRKYSGKGFGIIGVSTDEDEKDWRKALEEDKPEWTQILELKEDDLSASKLYGIRPLPFFFLVNREGMIIAKGSDLRGNKLDKTLEEYFLKKNEHESY